MEGIDNKNCIQFEAAGGEPDGSAWSYKLAIKPNNQFTLNFHHNTGEMRLQDESVDDWIYEGNFTASTYQEFYYLTFSNIYKTGTSKAKGKGKAKPIARQQYEKGMEAEIKPDGSCEFKKDNRMALMKAHGNNVKQFFDTKYPNIIHLKDMEMQIRTCLAKKKGC